MQGNRKQGSFSPGTLTEEYVAVTVPDRNKFQNNTIEKLLCNME